MTPVLLMALMPTGLLLRDAAMVFSHDAGTGYLSYVPEVTAWAKTQSGTFAEQVGCGARVFDIRVRADGSDLKMHHGDIHIDTLLSTALGDIVKGAASVPGEVVIAGVNHFTGDNAQSMTQDLLKKMNITTVDCSGGITYEEAVAQGKQANGGSVLAMFGCWTSNYDPKITCYGPYDENSLVATPPVTAAFLRAHPAPPRPVADSIWKCGCYSEGDNQKAAFQQLEGYVNRTVGNPSTGSVWNSQIHWQESTKTVVEGNVCYSSLIDDNERSNIHGWILSKIASWPALNFIGINNVCQSDGSGKRIAEACKARNAKAN